MTLINDKIKYHQLNDWSHRERFGEDNPAVAKRLAELGQTRDEIAQVIEEAAAMGLKLNIRSNIEIELMPACETAAGDDRAALGLAGEELGNPSIRDHRGAAA